MTARQRTERRYLNAQPLLDRQPRLHDPALFETEAWQRSTLAWLDEVTDLGCLILFVPASWALPEGEHVAVSASFRGDEYADIVYPVGDEHPTHLRGRALNRLLVKLVDRLERLAFGQRQRSAA